MWALDKQAKLVLLKKSFRRDIRILSSKIQRVSQRGVGLRAVVVNFGFSKLFREIDRWALVSQRYSVKKNSLTPRSVSHRGVRLTYFAKISAKSNLSAKPFKPVFQGPSWIGVMKKCQSRDTATLNSLHIFKNCLYRLICVLYKFREIYTVRMCVLYTNNGIL